MKIRDIETIKLSSREFYEQDALAVKEGAEHHMDVVVVKVTTEDGEIGYGESIAYGALESVATTIEKILKPLTLGEEVSPVNLWDKMYKSTFRLGRRGIIISAISGIDIALWDILGKEFGAPIYSILGASSRRIKGYITGGYYRQDKDIEKLLDEVKSYIDKGFDTVKIKIGGLKVEEDLKRLRAIKDNFEKVDIAVDANNVYDFNTALKVGKELEKLGIIFFEEPIPTDFPSLSSELAKALDVPIAGYETAFTLYEFRDIILNHAVDIVQADAAWSGGITEMLRIGNFARAFSFPLIPHYSAGGIGFIASLHVALAINSPMIEYHLRYNPLREGLVGEIKYENGEFIPPQRPGLGISLKEEIIKKYRV
ncbi:mandelate racemase/muconate lactonizing enzyme family protein [Acidianus sp. HS-5]|uniref:mandelate racemase/muconate lactonizing enzyme family protein n=1 Tax=Acidianus sp. HS-5 TaxID=2886040 RepID=UPI001F43784D|nr:mandelate racemase/muconate lactonizing enzyme family protein [Acidianus sp. HS-5]BDC18832.1 mandelate racemase [Acidianus sp. HS-5]